MMKKFSQIVFITMFYALFSLASFSAPKVIYDRTGDLADLRELPQEASIYLPENASERLMSADEQARQAGDENVYFVDGKLFMGTYDRDLSTLDGCHPTDIGFLHMADAVEDTLRLALARRRA